LLDKLDLEEPPITRYLRIKQIIKRLHVIFAFAIMNYFIYSNKQALLHKYVEEYHDKVVEFMALCKTHLEVRLVVSDRVGHIEDLTMMTIVDPRFKHLGFKGPTHRHINTLTHIYYIQLTDHNFQFDALQLFNVREWCTMA
jgi:hypothetical protein